MIRSRMIRNWLMAEIASQLRCCLLFHSARLLAVVASASSHLSEQMTVTGRSPRLFSEQFGSRYRTMRQVPCRRFSNAGDLR
jgi:hypothetical protein